MIELLALHYINVVAEQGSFRRAAAVLGVRASVVSRRVRTLEDQIGVGLFQRGSQGVQPTVAGRRILAQGVAIMSDVETLIRTAALSGSGAEGELRVGIVASIAGGKARDLLTTFLKAHSGVALHLVEGLPQDHVAAVRGRRLDVALVVNSPSAPGCIVEPLWSEPIFVAVSAYSNLAAVSELQWKHLSSELFIVSSLGSGEKIEDIVMQHLTELGRRPVVEPRPVQRGGLLGLVSMGIGISLVGTAEASVTYPDVVFRPLKGELLPFSAIWADNNDNPALRRFLSLARARFPSAPPP